MAYTNFIPELWSARLLEHLDKVHVFAGLMNRDYEGEIKAYGDTVHINQIGDVTISNYDGSDISDPEELDSTQRDLKIDQGRSFNFQVKDIDNAQTNPKLMDNAMQRASYAMNDTVDRYLGLLLAAGVDSGNVIGSTTTPVVPTSSNAYDYLVDLGTLLSEADVPMLGRWVVVPPFFHGLLQKDDRFVGNGTGYNQAILEGGLVGEAAGFAIHVSNNVPNAYAVTADTSITSGKTYYTKDADSGVFVKVASPLVGSIATYYEQKTSRQIVAGSNIAGAYAEQLVEIEAYRPEKNFSDAVKGLNVFGAKVVQPKALAVMICSKS